MNQQEWKIGLELAERYPVYTEYLAECGSPEKADQMLTAQGLITESELLQLYCRALGLDQDDDELKVPERFPQIAASYLTINCCIPYTLSLIHI